MNIDPSAAQMIITNLLAWLTTYTTYKVAMKNAEIKKETPPEKPKSLEPEVAEKAIQVVEKEVEINGTVDEKADLANYQRSPIRYQKQMEQTILDLALRNPTFLRAIQSFLEEKQSISYSASQQITGNIKQNININSGSVTFNEAHGNDEEAP